MKLLNLHRNIDHFIRNNPYRVDAILGAGYTLLAMGSIVGLGHVTPWPWLVLILFLESFPLTFRRKHPWSVTLSVAGAHLLQAATFTTFLPTQLSVPILIYTMAVYGERRRSIATLWLGILGALLSTASLFRDVPYQYPLQQWLTDAAVSFIGLTLVVVVAWTFGDLARTRRQAIQALEDRAKRLEMERQYERDLAASDERSHIAREMHDIVAHSLSVIITQADGGRYAAVQNPQIALDTLQTISNTGRTSLREMRRLLGVLRTEQGAATRPLPTLSDLPGLVETSRKTGLEVALEIRGERRRDLPGGAELTVYRCVQEGLTNVIKHAGPSATAQVELVWSSRGLTVEVADNGRGAGALATEGTGQGLNGMKERVSLYDGTTTAGPRAGGGFLVSAFIPYTED